MLLFLHELFENTDMVLKTCNHIQNVTHIVGTLMLKWAEDLPLASKRQNEMKRWEEVREKEEMTKESLNKH